MIAIELGRSGMGTGVAGVKLGARVRYGEADRWVRCVGRRRREGRRRQGKGRSTRALVMKNSRGEGKKKKG